MDEEIVKPIPQIIGHSTINREGKIRLKRDVLKFINAQNETSLFLEINKEIILSTKRGSEQPILKNKYLQLPKSAIDKLEINGNARICFIHRSDAVAVKRFDIAVKISTIPRIIDFEKPYSVLRQVETFDEPNQLLQNLLTGLAGKKLRYNIIDFWREKTSFNSWKARRLLGETEDSDDELRNQLIQKRLHTQSPDGSWEGLVTVTAKNLLELSELGMNSNYPQLQKGIKWLFERRESPHNPGMFFLTDELVAEQLTVINLRKTQTERPKERFRKRPKHELKLVTAFDDLYFNPSGPRIMWPNAIVLETLLTLGYEYHERVCTLFETLLYFDWCEYAYQYGRSGWRKPKKVSLKEIERFENQTKFEFLHGGIPNLKYLTSWGSRNRLTRLYEKQTAEGTEYSISMPAQVEGCELITTNALSNAKDEKMSRSAEAHLWRFAILLYNSYNNPGAMQALTKMSLTPYFFLKVFAKYNSLPARLGIAFSLPWIIENQNEDGSWGTKPYQESATLAVINALKKIDKMSSENF